jgi:hypothetical protein
MDVMTVTIVTFGALFVTIITDNTRKKNEKIEAIIERLQHKIYSIFDLEIDVDKQTEYLYTFKYIENKINVLEKLAIHLECRESIDEIKKQEESLNKFVMDNLCEGNDYFKKLEHKNTIPNTLCNIETHLDKITLKIYVDKN